MSERALQSISLVSEDLNPTITQILKFAGHHLTRLNLRLEDAESHFDWKSFFPAIEQNAGDTMSFSNFKIVKIKEQASELWALVNEIVQLIHDSLKIDFDQPKVAAVILNTLTNLGEEKEKGFLQFALNGPTSSWEYRVAISVPNDDLPSYFYTLVTTILISGELSGESSWYYLTDKTCEPFSVQIDSMKLVFQKDFKDPGN